MPVDFSDLSKKALQYAVCMAQEFGAELILLHVVEPYPFIPEMPAATAKMQELWQNEGAEKLKKWESSVENVFCISTLRIGMPGRTIVEEATAEEVDLIILGTHGRSGLAHLFLGSVAERVVQTAPCPVLIVRDRRTDLLRRMRTTHPSRALEEKFKTHIPKLKNIERQWRNYDPHRNSPGS